MQGGRDKLGWIRQLTFTESQPVYTSEPCSSLSNDVCDGVSTAGPESIITSTEAEQESVMQGGRDKLGWIRQLVTFTESQPVYTSEPRSSLVEYDPDAGFQRTVFPSLNPSRREDVALLEQWMLAMMDQISAALPKHLRSDPTKVSVPEIVIGMVAIHPVQSVERTAFRTNWNQCVLLIAPPTLNCSSLVLPRTRR